MSQEVHIMNIIKNLTVPVISAIVFDLIAAVAIAIRVYWVDGYVPSFAELFFSSPICYFWIFWTSCIFFCFYGIRKEYRSYIFILRNEFPLIPDDKLQKMARREFIFSYSKKCLAVFAGFPLAAILLGQIDLSHEPVKGILLTLIPFFINLAFLLYLYSKRREPVVSH